MSKGFVLQRRSAESWLKAQSYTQSGGGTTFIKSDIIARQWKPSVGKHTIRILPPDPSWQHKEEYGVRVGRHFQVGGGTVLCPTFMHQQFPDIFTDARCPICEDRLKLYKNADPENAKKLFAKEGIMMWLIDRDNEKAGPQWWIAPMKQFHMSLMVISFNEKKRESIFFDDPYEGRDVSFITQKSGGSNQYMQYGALQLEMEPSPIFENEKNLIGTLDFVVKHSLPSMVEVKSYEEIQKLWGGIESQDDDHNDDDYYHEDAGVDTSTYSDDNEIDFGSTPEVELDLGSDVEEESRDDHPEPRRRAPVDDSDDKLARMLRGDD